MYNLEALQFNTHSRLVILSGAGLSAESGIATFRDSNGLWEKHRVEDVATPYGFQQNPELVLRFYNERRAGSGRRFPNPGHLALAELQALLGVERCYMVSQNVDDLLERSGIQQLVHMHGRLNQVRCINNAQHIYDWQGDLRREDLCPQCQSPMRPHIVWFGEMPLQMSEIEDKLWECTHFLSIGTSGVVYPAAGFKTIAKEAGAKILHFNLVEEKGWDAQYIGPSGQTLPAFVQALKQHLP